MALAVIVLPVPGRPSNSRPRRGVPPICSANCLCVWNRSIERRTSSLTGSMPMTSSSRTSTCSGRKTTCGERAEPSCVPTSRSRSAREEQHGDQDQRVDRGHRRHDRTAQQRVDDDPRLDRDHDGGGAVHPPAADPVALDGDVVRASSDGGRDLVGHRHAFPSAPGFRRRCVAGGAICPSWVRPGESAISDIPDHPNGPTRHPSVRSVLRRASTSIRLSPRPSVR